MSPYLDISTLACGPAADSPLQLLLLIVLAIVHAVLSLFTA